MQKSIVFLFSLFLTGCAINVEQPVQMEYAKWFKTLDSATVAVFSPYGGADTLRGPVSGMVCMSSSYVGYLDAIGAADAVKGVSGLQFLGTPVNAVEVGYDAALNYEAVISSGADLFVTYTVSGVEPPYLEKLRELGVRTVVLSEHLESHPLARAEYVKLFGALTGRSSEADSVFSAVRSRYESLTRSVSSRARVLLNIPYADIWYVPGGDNYMTRLIHDAGGSVLGSVPGKMESSAISMEKAFSYSKEADFWLNTGWCSSIEALHSVNPFFEEFQVPSVWNNTLQTTPGGGNMFWETGPVRPDLILEDLIDIFSGSAPDSLHYYLRCR